MNVFSIMERIARGSYGSESLMQKVSRKKEEGLWCCQNLSWSIGGADIFKIVYWRDMWW